MVMVCWFWGRPDRSGLCEFLGGAGACWVGAGVGGAVWLVGRRCVVVMWVVGCVVGFRWWVVLWVYGRCFVVGFVFWVARREIRGPVWLVGHSRYCLDISVGVACGGCFRGLGRR